MANSVNQRKAGRIGAGTSIDGYDLVNTGVSRDCDGGCTINNRIVGEERQGSCTIREAVAADCSTSASAGIERPIQRRHIGYAEGTSRVDGDRGAIQQGQRGRRGQPRGQIGKAVRYRESCRHLRAGQRLQGHRIGNRGDARRYRQNGRQLGSRSRDKRQQVRKCVFNGQCGIGHLGGAELVDQAVDASSRQHASASHRNGSRRRGDHRAGGQQIDEAVFQHIAGGAGVRKRFNRQGGRDADGRIAYGDVAGASYEARNSRNRQDASRASQRIAGGDIASAEEGNNIDFVNRKRSGARDCRCTVQRGQSRPTGNSRRCEVEWSINDLVRGAGVERAKGNRLRNGQCRIAHRSNGASVKIVIEIVGHVGRGVADIEGQV